MQHIIIAQHDDITGLKQNLLEAHSVISQLANLISMMTNVTAGFTTDVEAMKKKLGVTVQSEEVSASPNNIDSAGGV
jgi:hypothetical protein